MNTKSTRLRGAAAAVSGARHVRTARNGQDAAAVWVADGVGAIVVCDGCGASASSEVGARLGAELVLGALARRLGHGAVDASGLGADASCTGRADIGAGASWMGRADIGAGITDISEGAFWAAVRDDVVGGLARVVRELAGPRERVVHDYFLFTIVAAAMIGDRIAVWAIGDGAYAIDGRVRELGPFPDNQPPYLAYDLVDGIPNAEAHVEIAHGDSVIVASDGVAVIGLDRFAGIDRSADRFVDHPDALRRQLAIFARGSERIDWTARRVERTPALLQDDGAVAMLVRGGAS